MGHSIMKNSCKPQACCGNETTRKGGKGELLSDVSMFEDKLNIRKQK